MKRDPAVAGHFYDARPEVLRAQVERCIDRAAEKEDVVAVLSPHAGIMYSGPVAGAVYSRIKMPDTFVILGPNHRGYGEAVGIISSGSWIMPNGEVKINSILAQDIKKRSKAVIESAESHIYEHSLEVQLPFIQYFSTKVKIVPICIKNISYAVCEAIATAIVEAIKTYRRSVVVIASSDMTHYEPAHIAKEKDNMAIQHILDFEPEDLYYTIINNRISMCGYVPTTIALIHAKQRGAERAHLVKYMTSGDITGDYQEVVGYAGILLQ